MLDKLSILIIIFSNFFFSNLISFDKNHIDNKLFCEKSGGIWRRFADECFDLCDHNIGKKILCSKMLEYHCDCGPDRCYKSDDKKCIKITDFKNNIISTN